jgi:hypothetical protein
MKILALLSVLIWLPVASLAACGYSDSTISQTSSYDSISCVASGYCTAYDLNPATGQYENYFGYHSSCPGHSQRTTMNYMCRRSNGSTYSTSEVVATAPCSAN